LPSFTAYTQAGLHLFIPTYAYNRNQNSHISLYARTCFGH